MAFPIKEMEYLSLEGGGGRGILYIEPINVLEEKIFDEVVQRNKGNLSEILEFRNRVTENLPTPPEGNGNGNEGGLGENQAPAIQLPVVNVTGHFSLIQLSIPPHLRKIKGISGSSAGAITAFMLSLGMSSEDIRSEMDRTDVTAQNVPNYRGPISVFEQLVDEKPTNEYKRIVDGKVGVGRFDNIVDRRAVVINGFITLLNILQPWTWGPTTFSKSVLCGAMEDLFGDGSPFGLSSVAFGSNENCSGFFGNLIGERGLFVGLKARSYFASLIEKYLFPALESEEYPLPETPPGELTFRQFYDLTGVDLVLTGTNITRHSTLYFSVYHTPDFPVAEAVQISMTLPVAFKPVYVDTDVRAGDRAQRLRYQGLFVDGGMLNNYPIHAFDNIVRTGVPNVEAAFLSDITYRGLKGYFPIACDPRLRLADCDCVLGMRLQEKPASLDPVQLENVYPKDKGVLTDFVKDLFGTLMYGSEEGQIRSKSDEERSVEFYATVYEDESFFAELKHELRLDRNASEYSLSVMDFSSPAIDLKRNISSLSKAKKLLMKEAGDEMKTFLSF